MVTFNVFTVLIMEALVLVMTNRNTFNINDINLADFCPLTLKDISKRRYRPFVHLLDTFDLDEKVYIKDYLTYFPYVLKSILYNSFETNKNLLEYESYFFNVCLGYSRENKLNLKTAIFSRYWSNFITEIKKVFDLQSGDFLGLDLFPRIETTTRFINCDPVNIPLKLDVLLSNYYVESPTNRVIVIPTYKYRYIYSNQLVIRLLNKFPNELVTVVELSLDSSSINVVTLEPTKNMLNTTNNYCNKHYIDFKSIHFSNCNYCPLKGTCSLKEMYGSLNNVHSSGSNPAGRTIHKVVT